MNKTNKDESHLHYEHYLKKKKKSSLKLFENWTKKSDCVLNGFSEGSNPMKHCNNIKLLMQSC